MALLISIPKLATFKTRPTPRCQKYNKIQTTNTKSDNKPAAQTINWVLLVKVFYHKCHRLVCKFVLCYQYKIFICCVTKIKFTWSAGIGYSRSCIIDQEDTGALMQMVQLVPATDSICQLRSPIFKSLLCS